MIENEIGNRIEINLFFGLLFQKIRAFCAYCSRKKNPVL